MRIELFTLWFKQAWRRSPASTHVKGAESSYGSSGRTSHSGASTTGFRAVGARVAPAAASNVSSSSFSGRPEQPARRRNLRGADCEALTVRLRRCDSKLVGAAIHSRRPWRSSDCPNLDVAYVLASHDAALDQPTSGDRYAKNRDASVVRRPGRGTVITVLQTRPGMETHPRNPAGVANSSAPNVAPADNPCVRLRNGGTPRNIRSDTSNVICLTGTWTRLA